MLLKPITITAAIMLAPLCAHAQYKCLAPDGVTEYRATPCPGSPDAKRQAAQSAARRDLEDQLSAQRSRDEWQRRASDLERRQDARKAEEDAIQARRDAAVAADANKRQAVIDKAAAVAKAKAEAAERNRPVICSNFGSATMSGNTAYGRSVSVCQ